MLEECFASVGEREVLLRRKPYAIVGCTYDDSRQRLYVWGQGTDSVVSHKVSGIIFPWYDWLKIFISGGWRWSSHLCIAEGSGFFDLKAFTLRELIGPLIVRLLELSSFDMNDWTSLLLKEWRWSSHLCTNEGPFIIDLEAFTPWEPIDPLVAGFLESFTFRTPTEI